MSLDCKDGLSSGSAKGAAEDAVTVMAGLELA